MLNTRIEKECFVMKNNRLKGLTAMIIIMTVLFSFPCAVSANSEPFLSEIQLFSFNFAPKGWALCNGQLLPINQNQALFSLLGTTYGGDGRTTFALPNLNGNSGSESAQPWGKNFGGYYCIALQGIFPSSN